MEGSGTLMIRQPMGTEQSQLAPKEGLMKNGNRRRKRGLLVVIPKRSGEQSVISYNELWLVETALETAEALIKAARRDMARLRESKRPINC